MIKDIIDQIKESEKKAQDIIAASKKESSEIIEKAYKKADRQVRDTELKAKKMLKDAEAKAVQDARRKKEKLEAEYDSRIRVIRDDSRIKEEKAIQKLVDRVLE